MIELCLWVFGKPEWELDLGDPSLCFQLQQKGEELFIRLLRLSFFVSKLEKAGWQRYHNAYSLLFHHPSFTRLEDAAAQLELLGIPAREVELFSLP